MPPITPIPSTRVSNLLVRSRLLTQLQFDQRALLRVQSQVSTGRRIFLPSEDANAAQRAISLQSFLERKSQVAINLQTNQSFLEATDSALGNVSSLLADIRGAAISVVGDSSGPAQRAAVAEEVDRAIQQLVDIGNQSFRGRFLFTGTQTAVRPFERIDGQVQYNGNDGVLRSYSDLDVLFETSAHGDQVFGALSTEVRGTVDLNPVLNGETLLSDLYGGQGISRGVIRVSDGTNEQIVDLTNAVTLNDVKRAIESNPPAGRQVSVTITATGLNVELDAAGLGNLTITEVGTSDAAAELDILEVTGVGVGPKIGSDLQPVLKKTTRLSDILGAKASAHVVSPGFNNDILVTATQNGAQYNGVSVQLVDDSLLQASGGLTAGNETASYDSAARAARAALTLPGGNNDLILTAVTPGAALNNVSIRIVTQAGGLGPTGVAANYDGVSQLTITLDSLNAGINASDIQAAIAADGAFTTSLDTSVETTNSGAGVVDGTTIAQGVYGNTGVSGGDAGALYVHIENGVSTAEQIVDAINANVTEFSAETDIRDADNQSLQGKGVVSSAATAVTSGGAGTVLDLSGVRITSGAESDDIDFSTAETIEDLLNLINGSPLGALAEINDAGTGINIRSRRSGGDFGVGELGGATATQLGVRTFLAQTELADLNLGLGVDTINGADFIVERNDGALLDIDVSGATTVNDVIALINGHANNVDGNLVARLAANGNGIELVDSSVGAGPLNVQRQNSSPAAIYLGLVPEGQDTSDPPVSSGADQVLTGRDVNPIETAGVFTALVRLEEALRNNDSGGVGLALERLDAGAEQLVFTRGEIGARLQSLDVLTTRLEDEQIQLQEALSVEIDVDLAAAISELTSRQFAFQASLQSSASILQLTLLNFL